jgi:hypothetical protein
VTGARDPSYHSSLSLSLFYVGRQSLVMPGHLVCQQIHVQVMIDWLSVCYTVYLALGRDQLCASCSSKANSKSSMEAVLYVLRVSTGHTLMRSGKVKACTWQPTSWIIITAGLNVREYGACAA